MARTYLGHVERPPMVLALAVLVVSPVGGAAQDTASRVARAVDLAAAHAIAVDSVAAVAATWRTVASRTPGDRFAALGLASLARLRNDTSSDAALAQLATGSDAVARRALLERGALTASTGRLASADSLYVRAAVLASSARDSIAEAEAQFGRIADAINRFALAAAQTLLPLADSVRPPSDALLGATSACVHAALRPSDSAFRAATAQADRAGDPRLAARCLAPLPAFLFAHGLEDSADHVSGAVIDRFRRVRDHGSLAIALMLRCYHRVTRLDYSGAATDCEESAREGVVAHSPYAVGWAELNLGVVSRLLGDAAGARLANARGRAALSAINDRRGLGILRRTDADLALDANDTAAAHVAALDALHDAGPGQDAGAAWSRLADIALHERRYVEAKQDLDSNLAALVRGHAEVFIPAAKLKYGTVLLREGHPQEALAQLIPTVYDTNQIVSRYLVNEQRVEALLALGRPGEALREMEQATDDLERWRGTLTDRELRVLAFQTRPLFGGPSPAIAAVVASAVRRNESDRAFALAERRRARDLADQRRRALVMGHGADRPSAASLAPLTSLTALRRAIPDDSSAVLEYVTGPVGAATTVFIVTRHGAEARVLTPADSLADDIALFDDLVDQRQDARAVANTLGSRVLLPVLRMLPGSIVRLVVVPDGPLYRIPFAALRLTGGVYAVERYAITFAPSATVAADLWSHPLKRVNQTQRVLAFGDATGAHMPAGEGVTVGARGDLERTAASSSATDVLVDAPASDASLSDTLPRLPWSGDEARMVAAFGRGSIVRLGRDATPEALMAAPLDSFAVVHFATHAIVDEQMPARSALVLSAQAGRSGLVDAGMVEGREIPAALVVLSACRTARGALVEGEGVRGLTNPFLGAGAHAVVATQWAIGDRAAVPLVYAFYRGLASGLPATEALRRAEQAASRSGAPIREWAAFTLIGDPLVRVPLEIPARETIPEWVRASATGSSPRGQ